jgi:hypothetical protein
VVTYMYMHTPTAALLAGRRAMKNIALRRGGSAQCLGNGRVCVPPSKYRGTGMWHVARPGCEPRAKAPQQGAMKNIALRRGMPG